MTAGAVSQRIHDAAAEPHQARVLPVEIQRDRGYREALYNFRLLLVVRVALGQALRRQNPHAPKTGDCRGTSGVAPSPLTSLAQTGDENWHAERKKHLLRLQAQIFGGQASDWGRFRVARYQSCSRAVEGTSPGRVTPVGKLNRSEQPGSCPSLRSSGGVVAGEPVVTFAEPQEAGNLLLPLRAHQIAGVPCSTPLLYDC